MKVIAGFLVIVIIGSVSVAAYRVAERNISLNDLIDYTGETARRIAGETGQVLEAAVTVACTTMVRTEVGPMISRQVLVGLTERIVSLRCGSYNGRFSGSGSISIPKEFIFDWMKRDGYTELWIHTDVSVPVVIDLNSIEVQIDRRDGSTIVTYNLPSPELDQPRIDFSTLLHSVDAVRSMSNEEIAEAADSLFNSLLSEACQSVSVEAMESSIIGNVRSQLSRDLIGITNSLYPEASVDVNFIEDGMLEPLLSAEFANRSHRKCTR